jgi:hypothetical protein
MIDKKRKTVELIEYLYQDYRQWRDSLILSAEQRGEKIWEEPDLKRYCAERLQGLPYESFMRWKAQHTPVSEVNLLRIALALGETKPLEIYGFEALPRELWAVVVNYSKADPDQRKRVRSILEGCNNEVVQSVHKQAG